MKKIIVLFGLVAILLAPFAVAEDPAPAKDEITVKLEKVLYPCVRVTNGNGGGSGTVVYCEDREKTGDFQTFVVTNHHVVDSLIRVEKVWDNLTQSYKYVENNNLADVELFVYANGGRTVTKTSVKADIIAYVADEDIALLRLRHPFQVPFVSKILPPGKQLRLFQQIYAVGCPLLVDPMFTSGEVTDIENLIDNKPYTGGTANIIWGNSGGAVISKFEDGEWYFCGIPSRGYGAPNGQFVTYLGYYITPERILGFIKTQKVDFLVNPEKTPTECLLERSKSAKKSDEGPRNDTQDKGSPAPPPPDGGGTVNEKAL